MTRALLGLGLITGLGSGCAFETRLEGCSDVGCPFVAIFDVISTQDMASLTGATLEVCIESRCVTVAVPMAVPNVGGSAVNHGDFTLRCDVYQSGTSYDIKAVIDQVADSAWLAPGDVYTLSLTAMDGTLLIGKSWTATSYTESDPNGPDCEPHCVTPQLTPVM